MLSERDLKKKNVAVVGIPHVHLFPVWCQMVAVFWQVFQIYIIIFSLILGYRGCLAYGSSDVRVDHGMGDQRNSGNVDIHHARLRELQVVPQVPVGPADAHRLHLTWWTHHQGQLHQLQRPALPPVIHGAEPGISPTELKSCLTATKIRVLCSVKSKRKVGRQAGYGRHRRETTKG